MRARRRSRPAGSIQNGVSNQGQSDFSYGITENWQSKAGSPAGGTDDISLAYPNGGGFQPIANLPRHPPLTSNSEASKNLTLDVKAADSKNYPFFISHISRLPPGDVYPRQYVELSSYCTPVVNQWVTCKIPLSDLSMGFTKFTASISGNHLTVTSIQSGVGVDAGGFISGPGIPANTYITSPPGDVTYNNGQPPGANLLGVYTIAGPGVTAIALRALRGHERTTHCPVQGGPRSAQRGRQHHHLSQQFGLDDQLNRAAVP